MRQRTSYSKPFKAQVVQECLQPGVSIASVALRTTGSTPIWFESGYLLTVIARLRPCPRSFR